MASGDKKTKHDNTGAASCDFLNPSSVELYWTAGLVESVTSCPQPPSLRSLKTVTVTSVAGHGNILQCWFPHLMRTDQRLCFRKVYQCWKDMQQLPTLTPDKISYYLTSQKMFDAGPWQLKTRNIWPTNTSRLVVLHLTTTTVVPHDCAVPASWVAQSGPAAAAAETSLKVSRGRRYHPPFWCWGRCSFPWALGALL